MTRWMEPRRTYVRPTRVRRVAVPLSLLALLALTLTACAEGWTRAADPSSTSPAPITEWRTEAWHDLAVDVPADWGWGTAPIDIGLDGPSLCGAPAPSAEQPYVGRPLPTSDVCMGRRPARPAQRAVRLDGCAGRAGDRRPWVTGGSRRRSRRRAPQLTVTSGPGRPASCDPAVRPARDRLLRQSGRKAHGPADAHRGHHVGATPPSCAPSGSRRGPGGSPTPRRSTRRAGRR